MAYTDFTLETVDRILGVRAQPAELFPQLAALAVPDWLRDVLAKGMELSLLSEKARSEFIVVPILLASRELSHNTIAIYSGQRLDVNPKGCVTTGEAWQFLRLEPAAVSIDRPRYYIDNVGLILAALQRTIGCPST